MSVLHSKTVTVVDVTNTAIVRPQDWNSQHFVGAALIGNTLGVSSLSGTDVVFSGGPNVTLSGIQGAGVGTLVVSAAAGGGGSVNFSAGTTSNNLGSVVFSNLNGVSFGLDGSTVTASIAAGGAPGSISAGTTRFGLGEAIFSNSNGISFGLDGATVTASHNALTSQSNQAFSAAGGSSAFQTLSFNNANGVSFSNAGGAVEASIATSLTNIRVSAGTTSNLLSALTFADANGISFGLNASTLTASYTVPTVTNSSWTVSDNATSGTVARLAFTNLNGVTLSLSTGAGGSHTIVGSHNALTSQSNQNVTAGNGGFAFQTLSFSNANGVSFGTSAGSAITASIATSLTNIRISAGTTSNLLSAVTFSDANGISFGLNASTITASYTVPTVTNSSWTVSDNATSMTVARLAFSQSNGLTLSLSTAAGGSATVVGSYTVPVVSNALQSVGSATGSGTNTSRFAADDHVHAGVFSVGVSNVGNTAGDTRVDVGRFVFAGGANITLSQATAAGALNTISIVGATAAPSPVNFSAGTTSNNLGTVVFSNSNRVSFGLNGSTITAQHALNFSAGTTSNNISDGVTFSNLNGVSFGLDGSTITASIATSLTNINVSAGTTSNNLSAVVFSNSNGVSFGLNGSTITASAGGGAADGGVFAGVSNLGATAGSTGTVSTGNVVFVGVSGITLSQSTGAAGSNATISIIAPQPFQSFYIPPWFEGRGSNFFAQTQYPGNGSVLVFPVMIHQYLRFSKFLASVSLSISTSSNSSHGGTLSVGFGVYTRNASTLSQLYQATNVFNWTNTSNNSTNLLSGLREFSIPFAGGSTLSPGDYWFAFWSRTSTANANWFTASNVMGLTGGSNSTHSGNFAAAAGAASFQPGVPGQGTYSATSSALPVSMAFSHITGTARFFYRPYFALRNFDP